MSPDEWVPAHLTDLVTEFEATVVEVKPGLPAIELGVAYVRLEPDLFGNADPLYAGTLDIGLEMEIDGTRGRYVTDWKSGRAIYDDHFVTTLGYALCEHYIDEDGELQPLGFRWDGVAVVHLREEGWAMYVVGRDAIDKSRAMWESLAEVHQFKSDVQPRLLKAPVNKTPLAKAKR